MQENRSANSRENQNGNERSPLYIVSVQEHRGEPGHTPDESVEADASGSSRGGRAPERDVGPVGLPRSALQSWPMRG